jgi:hypothetical protein
MGWSSSMKKFTTLNILGQKWPVYLIKEHPEYVGICYFDDAKIEIVDNLEKEYFGETLLHEFLHAVFYRGSFKQTGLNQQAEEIMVDLISKSLLDNFEIKLKK